MSNRHYLHCKTCNETSEDGINWGDERIRELWKIRFLFQLFEEKSFVGFTFEAWEDDALKSFIESHKDHDCEIVDEYRSEIKPLEKGYYTAEFNET
jgi:hypothetical protein